MSKLDEMLKRKEFLIIKIEKIQLLIKADYFHINNHFVGLRFEESDDEYDLILDMFARLNRNTQQELKEIDTKIAAINDLLSGDRYE